MRTNGTDYFVWLGGNTTLEGVASNITSSGYAAWSDNDNVSVLGNDGHWVNHTSGDGEGSTNVYTFDVIKTILMDDTGNQTINMTANPDYTGNYENRTFILTYVSPWGINYTGWSNGTSSTLGQEADDMSLSNGYRISVWDDTNYIWIPHFQGIPINENVAIDKWNVCSTRISTDRTWNQAS